MLSPGTRILHVAAEPCLAERLSEMIGAGCEPADINPNRYRKKGIAVGRFDMCSDLFKLPPNSDDIIMHMHVLEDIPCALEPVFNATMRALKQCGHFIFSAPIQAGISRENPWPDLTPEERTEAFGQSDHLRIIGRQDFPRFLTRVLVAPSSQKDFRVDVSAIGKDTIEKAAHPYAGTII
jgi:phosphoglycolate phosphatase